MKTVVTRIAAALFIAAAPATAQLSMTSSEEAAYWGGSDEISDQATFPAAPKNAPYSFRVWRQRTHLADCDDGPACAPERLSIVLYGSETLGGRSRLFRSNAAFAWEVRSIGVGKTNVGAGKCVRFVLRETYWKPELHDGEHATRDHRVCLKAESRAEEAATRARLKKAHHK
jgi:hypothetical protein